MKKLFFLCLLISPNCWAANVGASIAVSPTTVIVNQNMGCSVIIWNYINGASVNVISLEPQVWVTNKSSGVGGSAVPYAFSKASVGPGMNVTVPPAGVRALGDGGSLTFFLDAKFFAPSIVPPYSGGASVIGFNGSSTTPLGTGTYSIGAVVRTSDGSIFSPAAAATVKVLPILLTSDEQ